MQWLSLIFCYLCAVTFTVTSAASQQHENPPLSPDWVFDHWVWEDDVNTADALLELVNGYEERGIPVGAVIIDSPWSIEYNNFAFNTKAYPRPKELIENLHERGIRVVLWMTSMLNSKTKAGNFEPTTHKIFQSAKRKGYLVGKGKSYPWWKGEGAFVDYTNSEALRWWHLQMDRAMDLGIDGWKVDVVDAYYPKKKKSAKGTALSRTDFRKRYYSDMYDYTLSRKSDAAVLVRSIDRTLGASNQHFAPISKSNVTWVGDQKHTWKGLKLALRNILSAAKEGYAVVGSDIGGYDGPEEITRELLIRWAQLGALTPLMENGGEGKHAPWLFGEQATAIYRYFTKLHIQLKPLWYSLMVEAHRGNGPILRAIEKQLAYRIGSHILVVPITDEEGQVNFRFPEGDWLDFWNPSQQYRKERPLSRKYPLDRYPLFVKSGAIIPMQVIDDETGHGPPAGSPPLTFDIYPDRISSSFTVHHPGGEKVSLQAEKGESGVFIERSDSGIDTFLRVFLDKLPNKVVVNESDITFSPQLVDAAKDPSKFYFDEVSKRLYVLLPKGKSSRTEILLG